jgi:hypothetical protein
MNKKNVVVDDGCHKSDASINTFNCLMPYLLRAIGRFVNILETNKSLLLSIKIKRIILSLIKIEIKTINN